MQPIRTQKRVHRIIQKRGNTMTFERLKKDQSVSSVKGLTIENPSELPFKYRRDYTDMPSRESIFFLVGIPPEPLRDSENNPVDKQGNPIVIESPTLTRVEWLREKLPRGREFDCNGFHYTVMREVPLVVSDVNLYLLFICDYR